VNLNVGSTYESPDGRRLTIVDRINGCYVIDFDGQPTDTFVDTERIWLTNLKEIT